MAFTIDIKENPVTAKYVVDYERVERGRAAKRFFAEMRSQSEDDLSLDEINAEIAAARAERRARMKALS